MNKVILMGRLTKDPELSYTTTTNTAVCRFTLAVNRRFAKATDEVKADFFPVVAWAKTAEFCSKYFKKGQLVGVIGRVETRNWTDQEGKKHYMTEVVGEEAYFAESKKSENSGFFENTNSSEVSNDNSGSQNDGFYALDEDDDDLPF